MARSEVGIKWPNEAVRSKFCGDFERKASGGCGMEGGDMGESSGKGFAKKELGVFRKDV